MDSFNGAITHPLVSVIIAAYNAEQTIRETLSSIQKQSLEDYEVWIVDDGSDDNTVQAVQPFLSDTRFHLVEAYHRGVSAARNKGLAHASGTFVHFVDADDLLPPESLERMGDIVQQRQDTALVQGMYEQINGGVRSTIKRTRLMAEKDFITPDDMDLLFVMTLCNKWFRRLTIEEHQIRFREELRYYEDGVFLYTYLQYVDRIDMCPHLVYTYVRPIPAFGRLSTVQQADEELYDSALEAGRILSDLAEAYGTDRKQEFDLKFLSSTIVGYFYSKLWQWQPAMQARIMQDIGIHYKALEPSFQERFCIANPGIIREGKLRTPQEILAAPAITFLLKRSVGDAAEKVIFNLYSQLEPDFEVIAAPDLKERVSGAWQEKANFSFQETEEPFPGRGAFVVILDQAYLFDNSTVRQMRRGMKDVVAVRAKAFVGLGEQLIAVPASDCLNRVMVRRDLAGVLMRDGFGSLPVDAIKEMKAASGVIRLRPACFETEIWAENKLAFFRDIAGADGAVAETEQAAVIRELAKKTFLCAAGSNLITDAEQEQESLFLRPVLQRIEDRVIAGEKSIDQYKRLSIFAVKYGIDELIASDNIKRAGIYYSGKSIFSFRYKSIIEIQVLRPKEDGLFIAGFCRTDYMGVLADVFFEDETGARYDPDCEVYPRADKAGILNTCAAKGKQFQVLIPIRNQMRIQTKLSIAGKTVTLNPNLGPNTGLDRYAENSYVRMGRWLIKYREDSLCVYDYHLKTEWASERRYAKELTQKGEDALAAHAAEKAVRKKAAEGRLRKKALFISPRSNDRLLSNMRAVYDAVHGKKELYAKMGPYKPQDWVQAAEKLYTSKVVVTDDYSFYLNRFGKRSGQKVIQIWHAGGAFKKFGLDAGRLLPASERSYHEGYDLVSVSSEWVRHIYAGAFGIDVSIVQPLGLPRTDRFFEAGYKESVCRRIFADHPEWEGKQILVYAPTFRDGPGKSRAVFAPTVDFAKLSSVLSDNQLLVICPHPVMKNTILEKPLENIQVVREYSTEDMLFVADLLITDYSSIIFDYSLLNKPVLFFCYDYDTYDRNYYLDYAKDLPGDLLRKEADLREYLAGGTFSVDARMAAFRERFMSACDGHSSQRVAEKIDAFLKG